MFFRKRKTNMQENKNVRNKETYGIDNLQDDTVGLPIENRGVPVVQSGVLLSYATKKWINPIRDELGLSDTMFDELVKPVFENLVAFVDLLPASEYHHHHSGGGLLAHSLDTAFRSMRKSKTVHFPQTHGTLSDTKRCQQEWETVAVLGALLHDVGKVVTDIEVSFGETEDKEIWDPYSGLTINQWAYKHKIDRYFVRWLPGRYSKHSLASVSLIHTIVPQPTISWLGNCFDGNAILNQLRVAVAKAHSDHPISKVVHNADHESVEHDLLYRHSHISQEPLRRPPCEVILLLIRGYISKEQWQINVKNGLIWYVNNDLYIAWANVVKILVKRLKDTVLTIPESPDALARMMVESGLAVPNADGFYFDIYPEILGAPKKPVRLTCLKLRYVASVIDRPEKLYGIREHKPLKKQSHVTVDTSEASSSKVSCSESINKSFGSKPQVNEHSKQEAKLKDGETAPTLIDDVLPCPAAEILRSSGQFDIVAGKVQVSSSDVDGAIELLLASDLKDINNFNAYSLLKSSSDITVVH